MEVMANGLEIEVGTSRLASSRLERAAMIGTRPANSIRASGQRPHTKAAYMTAPDKFAEIPEKALAERGPSIHDAEVACVHSSGSALTS